MKNNIKKFKPLGPFEVNFDNMPGGKRITKDHIKNFWAATHELNDKVRTGKGVYIFGMRVARAILPCYVGKTMNSFERECFTERNLNIYNGEIIRYERNYKPFMFFVVYQHEKSQKITDKVVRELEGYAINLAVEKNPDLANTRGTENDDRFSIIDVGGKGSGKGASTKPGKFLKEMMGF